MAATEERASRTPTRVDGYAPIRDYAVIGNKRTAALVALDGSIDWLCLPDFAGASVFGALLDAGRGGSFTLRPAVPFTAVRRYVPDTNVLQTTFTTANGTVTVTDAMTRPIARGLVWNQIVRRIDARGTVPMEWAISPRFDYGDVVVTPCALAGAPGFVHGRHALAVEAHGVGEARVSGSTVHGAFTAQEGEVGVLALSAFHDEPVTLSNRDHLLQRLDATIDRWRRWLADCSYEGPWQEAVRRSALALDLLVDDQSGAIAAAVTMGLPERIGGPRNYDYRYGWLRDTNMRQTRPRLPVMYRLDGELELPDDTLRLDGYQGSRPVTLGNSAQDQLQLGNYGDLLDMTRAYVSAGGGLHPEAAQEIANAIDHLCSVWRKPDASIWELDERRQYTQGKLAVWLAFTHAADLADDGQLPAERAAAWRREAAAVERYVRRTCWSDRLSTYTRASDGDDLDAAVLLATRGSFVEHDAGHLDATVAAIRRHLGAGGPLLYRFSGADQFEGAFVACSFWTVEALVRVGKLAEAVEMMDELVGLANDVGLFSEEIDPATGAFLGNLPQALSHLALVNAAVAAADAR